MLLIAPPPALWAETFLASLRGSVRDQTGTPVPKATVKALHVETGRGRAVSSNREGQFEIPQLNPGVYKLEASQDGFIAKIQEGVELGAG